MYTYRVFPARLPRTIDEINLLLDHLCKTGWEPVEIYWDNGTVLAKKTDTLTD